MALLAGAFLLLLVVSWRSRHRAARAFDRQAAEAFARARLPNDASEDAKIAALFAAGVRTLRFVEPADEVASDGATGTELLELTRAANKAFDRRDLVPG